MIRRAEARSPEIATGEERSAESRERRNRPDEWKLFTEQRSATRLDIRRAEARSPEIATGEERSAESRQATEQTGRVEAIYGTAERNEA